LAKGKKAGRKCRARAGFGAHQEAGDAEGQGALERARTESLLLEEGGFQEEEIKHCSIKTSINQEGKISHEFTGGFGVLKWSCFVPQRGEEEKKRKERTRKGKVTLHPISYRGEGSGAEHRT